MNVKRNLHTRRQTLAAGTRIASAWALAACGAQSGEEKPAAGKVQGSIEFWQWGVTYVDGFNKLAADFNAKANGARVNHSQPDGYDDKIKVTIAAGSGAPDVYLMRGPNHKQWAHDGLAIDITQYANRDKAAATDLKTMHKVFYDYYHLDGKLHGAPWDLSTISVAYNLDMLESRGLKPPSELGANWDWNTFLDYAKRLTPADGNKYGVDAANGIETGFYNWVVANGGNFFSEDYKKVTVNTPRFLEAVESYMSASAKLAASPPRAWVTQQTTGLPHRAYLLINGLVGMQTAGDWFFPWYEKSPQLRWDVAPHPYASRTKKTGSIANMRGLVVAPTTQNKELAWAWIANLIKREVQDQIPSMMGEVPARLDSIDAVYLNPAKSPSPKSRKLLKAAIESTQPLPGHPLLPWSGDNSVSGTANLIANDVYDGKRAAKDAVAEVHDKLTALIGGK